jgi:hypothetical protein
VLKTEKKGEAICCNSQALTATSPTLARLTPTKRDEKKESLHGSPLFKVKEIALFEISRLLLDWNHWLDRFFSPFLKISKQTPLLFSDRQHSDDDFGDDGSISSNIFWIELSASSSC